MQDIMEDIIEDSNIIFDLIIKKQFTELFNYIKNNPNIDLDVYDKFNNYLIQYLVTYNLTDIISYILENRNIRLDILDNDGRNLLYIPIKFNYIELLEILINYDKKNIGISIYDIRDMQGYTGLFYAVIFNNIVALKILYKENANVSNVDNMGNNIYMIALQYKRTKMVIYLLKHELNKNQNILTNYINTNGESILQSIIIYEDNDMKDLLQLLLKYTHFIKLIVNNKEIEYGLTALHQCVILNKNTIANELLLLGANLNQSDFLGNTSIHYAMIEKNYNFLFDIIIQDNYINFNNINFNNMNLNGDTPLHILLEQDINKMIEDHKYLTMLQHIILNTNINIQNNIGVTPLFLIVQKNLWLEESIKNILINGKIHLNLFITNKENLNIIDIVESKTKKLFIDMVVDSYYNVLKNTTKELTVPWEKYCATNNIKELIALSKNKNKKYTSDVYCKEYIKDMILSKKRSIPFYNNIELSIDSGIYKEGCFYTGSVIDILFGLIYLFREHSTIELILEYPLTENKELENYYTKLGINYNYKIDFSNIEIIWSYMKLILLTNFNSILNSKISSSKQFIIIPLGIEVATGSHANIIIIDKKNKTIERFEPNGSNYPRGLYYNPELLDSILYHKFLSITKLNEYKYIKPSEYLPVIGFQILETLETDTCKKIGDPNGFCAVWCVWWADQRITNYNIKPNILAEELITQIKLANKSFKNLIRNYSINIVKTRDMFLEKYKLTIDDWMGNNYTKKQVNSIEQDIIQLF